jgi:hypothetical protein
MLSLGPDTIELRNHPRLGSASALAFRASPAATVDEIELCAIASECRGRHSSHEVLALCGVLKCSETPRWECAVLAWQPCRAAMSTTLAPLEDPLVEIDYKYPTVGMGEGQVTPNSSGSEGMTRLPTSTS